MTGKPRLTSATALLTLLTLLSFLGGSCTPVTMAYPVRIQLGPAPEPLARAASQVSFGGIFPVQLNSPLIKAGGVRQFFGLTSWLELDVDATLGAVQTDHGGIMGSLGLRFFPVRHRIFKLGLTIGGGLGCGGVVATGEERDDYLGGCRNQAPGRLAGGGYVGLHFGVRFSPWIAVYTAVRYQLTGATEIPLTHWIQYGGGIQADFPRNRMIFMTAEGGFGHFRNRLNVDIGFYTMGSIGVRFGKASRQPPRPRPRQKP